MFGIHFAGPKKKVLVVADIDSDGASVALLETQDTGPSFIRIAERVALSFEERSPEQIRAGLSRTIEEAASKAIAAYSSRARKVIAPSALYIVLGHPWSRSKMSRTVRTFQKEEKITDAVIAGLARETLASEKEFDTSRLLEANVSRIDLNGYPTRAPEGRHAHEAAVAVLVSEADAQIRELAQSALQHSFPGFAPRFRSRTRALLTVAADQLGASKHYVAIDVNGEGTSIAIVRKGILSEQIVMQEGMRAMLGRVAGKGLPEEALAMMRMLEQDQCSGAQCETVSQALAGAEPELVRVFGEAFATLSASRRLPNPLLLVAHPDLAPWLSRFFSRIDFGQFTITAQPFAAQTLAPQNLGHWVMPDTGVLADAHSTLSCALVHIEER